MIHLMMKTMYR